MATLLGIVCYKLAGLPDKAVVSAIPVKASIRQVQFGRVEGQPAESECDGIMKVLQNWWTKNRWEPSLRVLGSVQISEAPVASLTRLVETDKKPAEAAGCVAFVRALADRVQLRGLPSLEQTLVVGTFNDDGKLVWPLGISPEDVQQAYNGRRAQKLLVPSNSTNSNFGGIAFTQVDTLDDLLKHVLGPHPTVLMKLICEWLVLCEPSTQGEEAELWHNTERRAAAGLGKLKGWFEEIVRREPWPSSQTILAMLEAMKALAKYQTEKNETELKTEKNETELKKTLERLLLLDYSLTAVWMLTRWSFLLRERQLDDKAEDCLKQAADIREKLPITKEPPLLPHQLGRDLYYQGRFAEALEKHWQGYQLLKPASGANEQVAKFYNSAGKCFNDTYQFSLALELFERARRIRDEQPETQLRTYGAMGEAYWRLEKLVEAECCYEKNLTLGIEIDSAHGDQRYEMRGWNYLANVLFAQDKIDEAKDLYQKTAVYYRAQYEKGNTQELRNLVYSIEGLARAAAAKGQWKEVRRFAEEIVALVDGTLLPSAHEILPVALLGYVDALRLGREGKVKTQRAQLKKVEKLLSELYPVERAMVIIEQAIVEIEPSEEQDAGSGDIERAKEMLEKFFAIADEQNVAQTFDPIRQDVTGGQGCLGEEGRRLIEEDKKRWTTLDKYFEAAKQCSDKREKIENLREIQKSVVFFRDILNHIKTS